jgi:23S rRNA (cytosine1962-C5)-methyltransferase
MGVTCYRVYDHDLPEFPFRIERYEDKLYLAEYKRNHGLNDEEHERWMAESIAVISSVLQVPTENFFFKLRQRKTGRAGQYRKTDERQEEFVVHENGLKFIVNLGDYLDTGLFLDHRITRQLIREQSTGKKVLNLFAYTGSFSVYAAAGQAYEVVTVDLSNTYLEWAKRNMRLNGFVDDSIYRFEQADVKQYFEIVQKEYYDLIVMDPPTFSNSKRMDDFLDIQKDHVRLINNCLTLLKPGGILYFSTNLSTFILDKNNIHTSFIKDITAQTIPFDFEKKLKRFCFVFKK